MTEQEKEILEKAAEIKKAQQQKEKVRNKKKLKGLFMKAIIVFIFIQVSVFVYEVLKIFRETGSEPSTLIVAYLGFLGFENGCLSRIKVCKEKRKESDFNA